MILENQWLHRSIQPLLFLFTPRWTRVSRSLSVFPHCAISSSLQHMYAIHPHGPKTKRKSKQTLDIAYMSRSMENLDYIRLTACAATFVGFVFLSESALARIMYVYEILLCFKHLTWTFSNVNINSISHAERHGCSGSPINSIVILSA